MDPGGERSSLLPTRAAGWQEKDDLSANRENKSSKVVKKMKYLPWGSKFGKSEIWVPGPSGRISEVMDEVTNTHQEKTKAAFFVAYRVM